MFTLGGSALSALIAKAGGTAGADDKPENWSEERLDMEIQSEWERLGLARWTGRAGGFAASLPVGKFFLGGGK